MGVHETYAPGTDDVRANIIAAGEIIADLGRVGAPLAAWTVNDDGPDSADFPTLEGRATVPVVHAYARRWGVEAYDPMRGFDPEGMYLYADTETRGIHVRVWARADRPMADAPEEGRRQATPEPSTSRRARPGELCTCGRPAVVVYATERFGDVGSCEQEGSGLFPVLPCPWCGAEEPHREPWGDTAKCPHYRLRADE